MIFRGMELNFSIFDADDAERYEKALKQLRAGSGARTGEGLAAATRRQCRLIFDFFDNLFGDGFHKEVFGDSCNLLECVEAAKELMLAIREDSVRVNDITAELAELAPKRKAAK